MNPVLTNINIGVLGHVDSGKTSLSKALSVFASTAAFDKNPQSQERGITIDLGFSGVQYENNIFTFVDCPGHSSLIRTIIGGSQIIDMMFLVVDIIKGFETQTAECLILAEILQIPMVIILNKIDLIEESKRELNISKVSKKIQKTLSATIFSDSSVIPISATSNLNLDILIKAMNQEALKIVLKRNKDQPFIFAFDHCFQIKGKGTVLSGTVLQGSAKINDSIEIPELKIEKKIKSMQMFKKPIEEALPGSRCGICISQFDAKLLERGLVCKNQAVQYIHSTILKVNKVKHFKREIKSKSKFHISLGHDTVIGSIILFSTNNLSSDYNWSSEYKYEESITEEPDNPRVYYALLEFEHPVLVYDSMLLIGSKLDIEKSNTCRLAFWDKISMETSATDKNYQQTFLPNIKVFKTKSREGAIQRFVNDREVIVGSLFKKETNRELFENMKCELSTGEVGTIAGAFGKSSKIRLKFINPLQDSSIDALKQPKNNIKVVLKFKKFIFDRNHKMVQ
ncbi:unnamed protein product [Diamesa serratosioi]